MAGSSLLALIDDIASVLDDISMMTKIAARKTAGVLGDDLAVNAEQVSGVRAEREIPVVWAVFLGSLRNKAILVPAALAVSAVAPWLITPVLMLGGAFLCFEGFEKLAHAWLHPKDEVEREKGELAQALLDPKLDLRQLEAQKIRGAIRTDLILSGEIIVITLGTVAETSLAVRVAVLVGIALIMTIGVYGVVAAIVKLDDGGLWLSRRTGDGAWAALQRRLGAGVLAAAPWLMKALSVVGTIAMFLVGGGILVHGLPWLHELVHGVTHHAEAIPTVGVVLAGLTPALINGALGVGVGAVLVAALTLVQRARA